MKNRVFSRVALAAAAIAVTIGCSGSGKSTLPFLVTLNSTNGKLFVVHLADPAHVSVATTYLLGANVDTLNLSADRLVALASDTETSTLMFLDFHDPRNAEVKASIPAIISASLGPILITGSGRAAVAFNGGKDRIRTVVFSRLDEPIFSPVAPLSGTVTGTFPSPMGDLVLLAIGALGGEVSLVDAADPNALVLTFPWPTSGVPSAVAFSPLPGGRALACETDEHFVFVLGTTDLATRTSLVEGMLDPGSTPVLAVAAENRRSRGLAATQAGELVRFDFTDPTAPTETARVVLDRTLSSPILAVSPDDTIALLADASAGRLGVFRLAEDGAIVNLATFALGSAISRLGFTSDTRIDDYRDNPFAYALAGGNLYLVSLAPAVPALASPLSFSAIQDFFVVPARKGNLIAGIDSSGRVVLYDVRNPLTPASVSTTDVGLGSGARRIFFVVDESG